MQIKYNFLWQKDIEVAFCCTMVFEGDWYEGGCVSLRQPHKTVSGFKP